MREDQLDQLVLAIAGALTEDKCGAMECSASVRVRAVSLTPYPTLNQVLLAPSWPCCVAVAIEGPPIRA